MSRSFMQDLLARRITRLAAVQALAAAEAQGSQAFEMLENHLDLLGLSGLRGAEEPGDEPPALLGGLEANWAFDGVQKARRCLSEQECLDTRLRTLLRKEWPLERLNSTVRAALRYGLWEAGCGDVDPKVAVTEAIEVTRTLSDEDSASLVGAVLSSGIRL